MGPLSSASFRSLLPSAAGSVCRAGLLLLVVVLALVLPSCENLERVDPTVKPSRAAPANIQLDVDPIMRGTIASEAVLVGFVPIIVRGYGLVVGLKGTGSRTAPAEIRAWMLREMARRGVGDPVASPGSPTPEELLNSENCSIVVVEGIIPPGAPKGMKFDLRIFAAPGTATTSLEGGRLYTTELRPGQLNPGNRQMRALAEGKGAIVINPFADPTGKATDTVNRMSGRVLDGGTVRSDMTLRLRLATPSHTRSRLLVSAINSAFPREPGQADPTAVGKSSELVEIHLPPSWKAQPDEFVDLLRHTSLDPASGESTAMAVRRSVVSNPGASGAASWRWRSIGKRSVPIIQELYAHPEDQPRLAALNAGAKLDDPLAVDHLIALARTSKGDTQIEAIKLLGQMQTNPKIDLALRDLLLSPDIDVRLYSYEGLRSRGDPLVRSINIDGRFLLDVIGAGPQMIYVTQSGQPRIAIFGKDFQVAANTTLRTWGGRLIFKADEGSTDMEILYRISDASPAAIDEVSRTVSELTRYLGHLPSAEGPSPGIGLSFSETISALHELWKAGAITCDFKAEQDRILAAMSRITPDTTGERPMFEPEPGSEEPLPEAIPVGPLETHGSGADTVPR